MVERIEATSRMVKPVDMCAVSICPGFPQGYDNPVCLAVGVRPSHDGANAGIYGFAMRADEGWQHFGRAHAFTGASTSPLSMRLSAPWA